MFTRHQFHNEKPHKCFFFFFLILKTTVIKHINIFPDNVYNKEKKKIIFY